MPKPAKNKPATPRGREPTAAPARPSGPTPPADRTAEVHREADRNALARWVQDMVALVDESLLDRRPGGDVTDLTSAGAGMSRWERDTILRVLRKGVEG